MSNRLISNGRSVEVKRFPIGVVIPTYNRADVLISCLEHLERQTWTDFEVVVVDDGSTDLTLERLEDYKRRSSLHLSYATQKNSGPARARNVAISMLQAHICLMIGDDIFATPEFVAAHLRLHQERPEMRVAALGLTRWSEFGQTVTRFMRWLDESGVQFAYKELLEGATPNWKHFYTSNLSLKTQFLRENAFDETFTKAAMEDSELGYRLEQKHDLQIAFIPHALARHFHPTSFKHACKRMFVIGASARRFHNIWPSANISLRRSFLKHTIRSFSARTPGLLRLLTPIANALTSVWCPNPLMRYVLMSYYSIGYRTKHLSKM